MYTEVFRPLSTPSPATDSPWMQQPFLDMGDVLLTTFEAGPSTWTVSPPESDTKRLAAAGFRQPEVSAKAAAKLAQVDARFVRMTDEEVATLRKALPKRQEATTYFGPLPSREALTVIEMADAARFAPKVPPIPPYGTPMVLPAGQVVSLAKPASNTLPKKQNKKAEAFKEPRLMFDELVYWFDPADPHKLGTWAIGVCVVKNKRYYYKLARWGESLLGSLETYEASMKTVQAALQRKYNQRRALVAVLILAALTPGALGVFDIISAWCIFLTIPLMMLAIGLVPDESDYEL